MKNHPDSSERGPHNHLHSKSAVFEPTHPERYAAARKSTWASIFINLMLTLLQVIAGYFGRSQSLMADGLHSLSDLLADVMVLFANRHGNRGADARHPYGHARIETAATLILGAVLTALGISLLVAAAMRLQHPASVQPVHPVTFWVALVALAAKEGMFRYMLAVAMRVRSQMLIANAWHARSDAASSLVVLLGIGGNLLGFTFLDLVAAAVVGMIIAHMGGKFALQALAELIDTGLEAEEVAAIRQTLLSTPGVRGMHELRTRKMADNALVDAHIMVDPHISVSEGHYIAETARQSVLRNHEVMDVMVHIDPEDDAVSRPNIRLPSRDQLRSHLEACLGEPLPDASRLVLHYLDGRVEAEVFLDQSGAWSDEKLANLRAKCGQLSVTDPYFRSIHLYKQTAP
ncbi:MAG TPA: cation diffusion facilitator family transporter [Gallionellaceae bacterium]|nr:cation diffusion facilitator family transporter [Gallionellaceae bacterium]